MSETGVAYVSILGWPREFDRAAAVTAIVEATGMDPFMAGQRAAKAPPMVLAMMHPAAAKSAIEVLRKHRVACAAPTEGDLARCPEAVQAKSLQAAEGAPEAMYLCEPWRGEATGFRARDLFAIVRARLAKGYLGPVTVDVDYHHYGYGPAIPEVTVSRERSTSLSDVLDLWLVDSERAEKATSGSPPGWRRIRVNCDKFNFGVLGARRGRTDNENADRLSLMLAEQAPGALVDLDFGKFEESSGAAMGGRWQVTPRGGQRTDSRPLFEFYSCWSFIMHWYRQLRASRLGG